MIPMRNATVNSNSPAARVGDRNCLNDNRVPRGRVDAACPGDPERTCIMMWNFKRSACLCAVTAIALCLSGFAQAGTISMIVSNFDVQYAGNSQKELHEVNDPDIGALDPDNNEAQEVTTTTFRFDGALAADSPVTNPPTRQFVDMLVEDMPESLTLNSYEVNQGSSGVLNWFTDDGDLLMLQFDSIDYLALEHGVFSFFAEGTVVSQNLSGGLEFDGDVKLSYTSTDAIYTDDDKHAIASSGALTISGEGTAIPEPMALGLLGLVAPALGFRRRR